MKNERKRMIAPLVLIAVLFFSLVSSFVLLFAVDAVDASDGLTLTEQAGRTKVYQLSLSRPTGDRAYALMLEADADRLTVSLEGRVLYTYAAQETAGWASGRVYATVSLPEEAYDQPLTLRLTSDHTPALGQVRLCEDADVTRYYITNKTLGVPLSIVLFSIALCIPLFLLIGFYWAKNTEGFLFGSVLFGFSLLLLDNGGHYQMLTTDPALWRLLYHAIECLLPAICLLYFHALTEDKAARWLFRGLACAHTLFVAGFVSFALAGATLPVSARAIQIGLLVLDGAGGAWGVYRTLRTARLTLSRRLFCFTLVAWMTVTLVRAIWDFDFVLWELDITCLFAVALFCIFCFFFSEAILWAQKRLTETHSRIEDLEQIERQAIPFEEIARTLSESYESIYLIHPRTYAYRCYHESDAYKTLSVASRGEDFFASAAEHVKQVIHKDDQDYVLTMLQPQTVLDTLAREGPYSFAYRLMLQGKPVYHQIKVARQVGRKNGHIILGVQSIDRQMRHEKEQVDALETMLEKQRTHTEAILTSAAGYLEANLKTNTIVDRDNIFNASSDSSTQETAALDSDLPYSDFIERWCKTMRLEDTEPFLRISDRHYLISSYEQGKRRATVTFKTLPPGQEQRYYRLIFYLSRYRASGDHMALAVLYDVTEQHRTRQALEEMEQALSISRMKNFTSQMQPHFLYNALASIQEIVLDDPEYASRLIGDFTTHLRGCIRAMADDNAIPFTQELANIRAYVSIENMRFGEKLKVNYEIGPSDFLIMPLSIQPLVENAIQHGVYERGPQGGTVTVRTKESADAWIIEVEDDGVGFDYPALMKEVESGKRDSTGLKNLAFRLDQMLHAKVDVQSKPDVGTLVRVTIPKQARFTPLES